MSVTFDFSTRRASLSVGMVALNVPDFYDMCKAEQATPEGILYPPIAFGAGKFGLGGGRTSGLVVAMMNNWQAVFAENGQYQASVDNGTLIGGIAGQPIAYTNGVQVILNRPADAFTVSTSGGTAPSAAENAAALLAAAATAPIASNVKTMNDAPVVGDGTSGNKWRGV